MSYVLAIEPDPAQAQILRNNVSTRAKATVTVVASLASAMDAIDRAVPELVLVNPLIASDDERRLVERLRDVVDRPAPQILVTPTLRPLDDPHGAPRLFRRRGRHALTAGCDPRAFADDLSAYLPDAEPPRAQRPRVLRMPIRSAAVEHRESVRFERIDLGRVLVDGLAVDVVDVSLSGAQVLADRILRPGAPLHVLLARRSEALCCDAGVVWSSIDIAGSDLAYRAGLKLSRPDRLALERLYFGDSRFGGPTSRFLKGISHGDVQLHSGR